MASSSSVSQHQMQTRLPQPSQFSMSPSFRIISWQKSQISVKAVPSPHRLRTEAQYDEASESALRKPGNSRRGC